MKFNLKGCLWSFGAIGLTLATVWFCHRAPDQDRAYASTPSESVPTPVENAISSSNVISEPTKEERGINLLDMQATPAATSKLPEEDMESWAREHPEDALRWMATAPEGPTRDIVLEIACLHLAQADPVRAINLVEMHGANVNLMANIIHQWAERDLAAAQAYVLKKPAGEERDLFLSRIAFVRSQEDPAEAAKCVAEQISPGEIQNEAAISVLYQWCLRDTNAAATWAQLFPEGALRDRALKEVENINREPAEATGQ
jgi:hypothetical protein